VEKTAALIPAETKLRVSPLPFDKLRVRSR